MKDITKLADKWRVDSGKKALAVMPASARTLASCATELDVALPKWTLITDSKSLPWIEETTVLVATKKNDGAWDIRVASTSTINESWTDTWWRSLCGLDYPPGTDK